VIRREPGFWLHDFRTLRSPIVSHEPRVSTQRTYFGFFARGDADAFATYVVTSNARSVEARTPVRTFRLG
jgi:hypothetical protein